MRNVRPPVSTSSLALLFPSPLRAAKKPQKKSPPRRSYVCRVETAPVEVTTESPDVSVRRDDRVVHACRATRRRSDLLVRQDRRIHVVDLSYLAWS
jgi:hypothetical protein